MRFPDRAALLKKTVSDIVISVIILPVALLLIILFWLLLLFPNKGKVFFVQTRTGIREKNIKVIKFRTLYPDNTDNKPNLIRHFLRESHLDELPQILNVLSFSMSLVGPRPLLPEYHEFYDPKSKEYRSRVKPGITGLTQISGGKYLPWRKRFELDLFYIHHYSLCFDLLIFFRTAALLFESEKKQNSKQLMNDISFIEYLKNENVK